MPRMGKGGKREGGNQSAYANRTDLNNRGPQLADLNTAPGEVMGERGMPAPMPTQAHPVEEMYRAAANAPTPNIPESFGSNRPQPGMLPFTHETPRPHEDIMHGTDSIVRNGGPGKQKLSEILEAASKSPWATTLITHLLETAREAGL